MLLIGGRRNLRAIGGWCCNPSQPDRMLRPTKYVSLGIVIRLRTSKRRDCDGLQSTPKRRAYPYMSRLSYKT